MTLEALVHRKVEEGDQSVYWNQNNSSSDQCCCGPGHDDCCWEMPTSIGTHL